MREKLDRINIVGNLLAIGNRLYQNVQRSLLCTHQEVDLLLASILLPLIPPLSCCKRTISLKLIYITFYFV